MSLVLADKDYLGAYVHHRGGEAHQGEHWLLGAELGSDGAALSERLAAARQQGARYVLLGIPEDIGPRANLGRGGAERGWGAFLSQFANLQANELLGGEQLLLLGHIDTTDLLEQCQFLDAADSEQLQALRQHTAELDLRVIPVIAAIIGAGLEPIVIGGGHNNAFPILMGCSQALDGPMAAVNLDPHSDFRAPEGRHSGNGFAYAHEQGALGYYHVLGLHEQKNNQASLVALRQCGKHWTSLQQQWVRRERPLHQLLEQIDNDVSASTLPLGIEVDLDAIAGLASSAETVAGIPLMDALHIVYTLARHPACRYLHLAEGAPECHPAGLDAGQRQVGQALSELVLSYLNGRLRTPQ
ncbi:formimidoylglutamase [Ferrimonas sp. SCSIO 43195]|uniref:formimidoylglutamase n=1 Tax=Ferrimonas sp. SCSIO 43195 TaxID=2822844 RepID=UPI002075B610|nr:formimidoylglutamase [Ferrimonas sp. SCSIO 43195]USD37338.1 formimidoylglutamase [Ferrimonas sp. SCSIO 43195]